MGEILTRENSFAAKKLLAAKIFLIIALIAFLLPLLILPFFNHASTDDYFYGFMLERLGFTSYQYYFYTNWSGRFSATFVQSIFVTNKFLFDHYYLHSLLFLILNFLSLLFLLNVLGIYILKQTISLKETILMTFYFFCLGICVCLQQATFIFWFSSSVTFYLPVVLIQLELALLILLFNSTRVTTRTICMLALPLLFFVTNGFNEAIMMVQFVMLGITIFFGWNKVSKVFLSALFLSFFFSSIIVIFCPGNHERSASLVSKPIYIGAVAVAFHLAEIMWSLFKNPLFWFTAFFVFIYGNRFREKYREAFFIQPFLAKKWLLPVVILVFLLGSVILPVVGLKGGIVPDRYLNNVVYCMTVLLLIYAFVSGVTATELIRDIFRSKYTSNTIKYGMLAIGVLCNTFIQDAYKSIISAPMYNSIMKERETILKTAAAKRIPAIVNDYPSAAQIHLTVDYHNSPITLQQWVQQKPPLLFFEDDLTSVGSKNALKAFYHIDSIIVIGKNNF